MSERCRISGKVKYGKLGALFALVKLQTEDKPGHREKRSYFCNYCRRWHLTSLREWKEANA